MIEIKLNLLAVISIVFVGIVFYVLSVLVNLIRQRNKEAKQLEWVPGPRPHPIFGNSKLFEGDDFEPPEVKAWHVLYAQRRKYGTLFKLQIGHLNLVYLNQADLVEKVLASSKLIEKGKTYHPLAEWLGSGSIVIAGGDQWRRHRKLLTPSFHLSTLEDYLPVINAKSRSLCDRLRDKDIDDDVFELCVSTMLEVVMEAAMGIEVGHDNRTEDIPYIQAIRTFSNMVFERTIKPLYQIPFIFNRTSFGRKYFEQIDVMKQFTEDIVQHRTRQVLMDSSNDFKSKRATFLDRLIDLARDGQLSSTEIREQIDTITFAGHDTTGTAVSFALYLIGRHPEVQAKIHQELDKIFNDDQERDIEKNDLKQMIYLEATLKESLRLFPSAPLISRTLTEDLEIAPGQVIPKNVQTVIPIYILHRDPKEYPAPDKFIPERFLKDSNLKDIYPNERSSPFAYVPFSAGPRNCLGQKLAMIQLKVSIANIMRRYKLRSLDPVHDLQLAAEIVLKPKRSIRIDFKDRI